MDQIATFFGQIFERDSSPFEALPSALESAWSTGLTSDQIVVFFGQIAKKAGDNGFSAFKALPSILEPALRAGLMLDQIATLFGQITEKTGGDASSAFQILPSILIAGKNEGPRLFLRLLDQLTDYNRQGVLGLLQQNENIFKTLGPQHFPSHLEMYVEIFERWPRLGYAVLEGVLETTNQGIIPPELTPEIREGIFHYIDQTHGFIPAVYQRYLVEGDALFPKLKQHTHAILNDQLGLKEIEAIRTTEGDDYLLAIIQMVSPTSGASFVQKREQLGLVQRMIEAGDLRSHVPEAWKGLTPSFRLEQGDYLLKEGMERDPEGRIRDLLSQFRLPEGAHKVEEEQLISRLKDYLQAETGDQKREAREAVQKLFYALAGQNDALREKIDRIRDLDYSTLLLLEQLYGDKDNLQKMLADALGKVPEELFVGRGEKREIEGDANRLVKSLKSVWKSPEILEERKIEVLGSILKDFKAEDIDSKILARADIEESLKEAIRTVGNEAPALSSKRLIGEILEEPIDLIRHEKGKYVYRDIGSLTVGLRAVKGPAYGLYGLSAGVCTATDIDLWKNPNFKLLAITDEDNGQVVGYIHVFETIIDGKKYVTLPGINPSAEFLGTVDAQKLYEGIMEKVISLAQRGGYAGVYIPTNQTIHSNRADIHKAIAKAGYPIKHIPQVSWSTRPSYPFTEVYGVWENP